jgi:hypothetical protein
MSDTQPNVTPNVVIESTTARKVVNVCVSTIAVILGTVIVVDASSPAFDLSAWTNPVSAGVLYLASVFNLAVTLPNVPSRR